MTRCIPCLLAWLVAVPLSAVLVISLIWVATPTLTFSAQTPKRAITAICFRVEGDADLKCIRVTQTMPAQKTGTKEPLL